MTKSWIFLLAILGVIVLAGSVNALITEVSVNGLEVNNENVFIVVGSTNTFEVYFTADNNDKDVQVEVEINGQNINAVEETPIFDVLAGDSYKKMLEITIPYQSYVDYGDEAIVYVKISGDSYDEAEDFLVNVIEPASGDAGGGGAPVGPFTYIEVKINGVLIEEGDELILPSGQTSEIEVSFKSEVNDSEVVVGALFKDGMQSLYNGSLDFDVIDGETYQKTLTLDIPADVDQNLSYSLKIGIGGDSYGESLIFYHGVPDFINNFCLYDGGVQNNPGDLDVTMADITVESGFGEDNEWLPFDEVEIEVDVENNGDNDVDNILLEWGLYDNYVEEWIIDVDWVDEIDLRDGDGESISFTATIDNNMDVDLEDLNDGNHYMLYVRATGEVDNLSNDNTCGWDAEVIEIIIENDFVILKNIVIEPETVKAGQEIKITADVWNIGGDGQQDITVRISNSQLGIERELYVGDIDSFESESFETTVAIPLNTEPKTYTLELGVYDEDQDIYETDYNDDESRYMGAISVEKPYIDALVSAQLISGGTAGGELVIGVKVTNVGDVKTTFDLNAVGFSTWANSVEITPTSLTLEKGWSGDSIFTFNVNDDVFGDKLFNVEVVYNTELIVEQTVSVSIDKKDTTPPTITLLDPNDNENFDTSKDDKDIDFEFEVNDESEITSCTLFIDGDAEQTINSPQKNVVISVEENLDSDESYRWKVECTDAHGNKGISGTRDFDIDQKKNNDNDDNTRNTLDTTPLIDSSKKETKNTFVPTINLNEPTIKVTNQDKKTESPKNNFSLGETNNLWLILLPVFGIGIVLMLILIVIFIRR
jgi:hypothetical protein